MIAKPAGQPRARATPAARRMRAKNSSSSSPVAAAGNGNGSSSSSANAGGDASSSSSSASTSASSSGTAFDPRLSSDEIELWDDNGGPPTPLLVRFSLISTCGDSAFLAAGQTSAAYREEKKNDLSCYRLLLGLSLPRPFPLPPTPHPHPELETGHCQLPGPPQEPLPPAAPPALQGAPQRHHPHRVQDRRAPRCLARRDRADGGAPLRVQHPRRQDRVGRGAPGVRAQDPDW